MQFVLICVKKLKMKAVDKV